MMGSVILHLRRTRRRTRGVFSQGRGFKLQASLWSASLVAMVSLVSESGGHGMVVRLSRFFFDVKAGDNPTLKVRPARRLTTLSCWCTLRVCPRYCSSSHLPCRGVPCSPRVRLVSHILMLAD